MDALSKAWRHAVVVFYRLLSFSVGYPNWFSCIVKFLRAIVKFQTKQQGWFLYEKKYRSSGGTLKYGPIRPIFNRDSNRHKTDVLAKFHQNRCIFTRVIVLTHVKRQRQRQRQRTTDHFFSNFQKNFGFLHELGLFKNFSFFFRGG